MKNLFKKEKTAVKKEIDNVIERMSQIDPASEEYGILVSILTALTKVDETGKEDRRKSYFEILKIGGSLLVSIAGMVFIQIQNQAIMDFERDGTLRSSAWKFNPKLPFFGKKDPTSM